jgi:hypothetical protein
MHFEFASRAGKFLIIAEGEPGAHGAATTGTHGIGVSTPSAAAVAATTIGFAGELHIPKGMTFFMGVKSMMLAMGRLEPVVPFSGVTTMADGATPKLHWRRALLATRGGIA